MTIQPLIKGVYRVSLGFVSVFLIDQDGLTLIDSGIAGREKTILAAIQSLGKQPSDLRHILVTHLHGDHTGSLAALVRETGARVYMHTADAALIRQGKSGRPVHPSPGLINLLFSKLVMQRQVASAGVAAVDTSVELKGDITLDVAGGMRAVHTPGHTAGHMVYLLEQEGGILFAGDAVSNMTRLGYSPIYEDLAEGRNSIQKISSLKFNILCPAHGKPITGSADAYFRKKFAGLR